MFQQPQHSTEKLLAALDSVEKRDPAVGAFVDEVDRRQRVLRELAPTGPLRGLAVGVKDLYRVGGLATRVGSKLPAQLFEGDESSIVARLKAAGASILGKTAMDEFAYCEPPGTKNPRDPTRTPGGSSGGSAAAVAAGMCPVALGSQTLQSTIVPAAYCGVIGYKPTYERLPFDGVALSPSFDTVGFLAESFEVLNAVLPIAMPHWRNAVPDRPVLGIPEPWGIRRLHTEGWEAFERHCRVLVETGFELRPGHLPWNKDLSRWAELIRDLTHAEMAAVHCNWFDEYKALYRPRTRHAVERGRAVDPERLEECRRSRDLLNELVEQATIEAGIDAWICPATGSVAPVGYETTGDSWLTSFWSYTGRPTACVPVFDSPTGLSHGLQAIAPRGRDEELLAWASELAEVVQHPAGEAQRRSERPDGP